MGDKKQLIVVIGLGGTIAMADQTNSGGVVPSLTAKDIVASIPELAGRHNIKAYNFRNVPSVELGLADMVSLVAEIRNWELEGAAGVVITQGTDTIEETSWCLDLLLETDMPVVITGALRNPTQSGADGPANLLAAVEVAACEQARGKGILVVFNDEIHAARFVSKTNTSNVAAFQSLNAGRMGWITESRPTIVLSPDRLAILELKAHTQPPTVALLSTGFGDDGRAVTALSKCGFDGLVIEATGGGHTSASVANALAASAKTIPVVLASRTGSGQILSNSYGFPGSEKDLLSKGLISAGFLSGPKARVLLLCILATGCTGDAIRAEFNVRAFGGIAD